MAKHSKKKTSKTEKPCPDCGVAHGKPNEDEDECLLCHEAGLSPNPDPRIVLMGSLSYIKALLTVREVFIGATEEFENPTDVIEWVTGLFEAYEDMLCPAHLQLWRELELEKKTQSNVIAIDPDLH